MMKSTRLAVRGLPTPMAAMLLARLRLSAALCAAALLAASPAFAQGNEAKPGEEKKPAPAAAAAAKERQRQVDEIIEAEKLLKGAAGQPECVWLGRRVVSLLWRDDLDTAFRHLALYDKFGCPGAHIQVAFRCLIRNGNIDPKVPEALNSRVQACWVNPNLQTAAATTPAPAAPPASSGAAPQK